MTVKRPVTCTTTLLLFSRCIPPLHADPTSCGACFGPMNRRMVCLLFAQMCAQHVFHSNVSENTTTAQRLQKEKHWLLDTDNKLLGRAYDHVRRHLFASTNDQKKGSVPRGKRRVDDCFGQCRGRPWGGFHSVALNQKTWQFDTPTVDPENEPKMCPFRIPYK